jgi:hypothetical protein
MVIDGHLNVLNHINYELKSLLSAKQRYSVTGSVTGICYILPKKGGMRYDYRSAKRTDSG